jgi:hypothetical protein
MLSLLILNRSAERRTIVHHVSLRAAALLMIADILAWQSQPGRSGGEPLPTFEAAFVPGHRDGAISGRT